MHFSVSENLLYITLFLEGVWAQIYCEGRTKNQWNTTMTMVPRYPQTIKIPKLKLFSKIINLQNNKCLPAKCFKGKVKLNFLSWRGIATDILSFLKSYLCPNVIRRPLLKKVVSTNSTDFGRTVLGGAESELLKWNRASQVAQW